MNSWFDGVTEHQAAEKGESHPSKSLYILVELHGFLEPCLLSSADFRGATWKAQREHKRAKKGHF